MASILFLHQSPFEYPGVMSLIGYLSQQGHEAGVLIKSEEKASFWDKVKDFKPDWVGFSTIYGLHQESYRLAREAKERLGSRTIFGGPYVTYYPESIKREEIDYLIQGEGEEALLDFLNTYERGGELSELPNVWCKKNGQVIQNRVRPLERDLDKYPIPDRHHYYKYRYLRDTFEKQFMSGRGCPYNCYFCFNSTFRTIYGLKGKEILRRHSPARMIEELARCKASFPMRQVCFNDDVFIFDIAWLEEFLPRYKKEIGVPFNCQVRANIVTEEAARLLGESGCHHVMMGLESGNPRVRNEIMGKGFSNAVFLKACDILHRHGVRIKAYNIFGCPTETLAEAFETMELNAQAKIDFPWCALYHPVPGTRTYAIAQEHGHLGREYSPDDMALSIFNRSLLDQPEIREVERAQKLFYLGARHGWLIPLIRRIVKYNLGPIYSAIFFCTSFIRFLKQSRYNLIYIIRFSLKHLTNY